MANRASDTTGSNSPRERLPAVWPWLLIPLVALALFFALRSVRAQPEAAPVSASSSDDAAANNVR